jgi:glucokinase
MAKKYIIGVDLGGTKIYSALADASGKVLAENKSPTEAQLGKKTVFNNIFKSIECCLNDVKASAKVIKAIGIGVPGPVNPVKGVLVHAPNLPGFDNVNVRQYLAKKFKTKVLVANDAQAAAMAEAKFGAGKKADNFIYVTVSTGIGGGIVLNRKLYTGSDGAAGEVGHTVLLALRLNENNWKNYTLEKLASGTAVEQRFGIKAQELEERIGKGEIKAKKALAHLIHYLGIGLGNLTTIFNPDLIIVGGGLSNLGKLLIPPLEKEVKKYAFSVNKKRISVVKAKLGHKSGVLGALALCIGT